MRLAKDRVHSSFLCTLLHLISQLAHLGLAVFFTLQWHDITASCPPIGHALTSVFGALTAIYGALSTAKGYALLTHFCDEPWAKRTLAILSMVTSSTSALLACGALVLLELEVSGNITDCGVSADETPLLPSRAFLAASALLNVLLFALSFFLHWRQQRIDACQRAMPTSFSASFYPPSSFPYSGSSSSINPSAPPLSGPPSLSSAAPRLDPAARLYSADYFITEKPPYRP